VAPPGFPPDGKQGRILSLPALATSDEHEYPACPVAVHAFADRVLQAEKHTKTITDDFQAVKNINF
jgi:hypothetical protein